MSSYPTYAELFEKGSVSFTLKEKITLKDLRHYAWASGDYNPIHYDASVAQKVGLQGPIAHGMYCMGLIQKGLSVLLWGSPYRISVWENKFVAMVPLESSLTIEVKVHDRSESDMRLDVHVCLDVPEKTPVLKSKVQLVAG